MKISFVARYNIQAASTRLRVYAIHDALNKIPGVTSTIGVAPDADVVILQKLLPQQLAVPPKAKILYDFDDVMDGHVIEWADKHCHVFITDTLVHREWLKLTRATKPCIIMPDPIDYGLEGPMPASDGVGACWTGSWPNFEGARWMVDCLSLVNEPLQIISDLTPQRLGNYSPNVQLVPWVRESFVKTFRKSCICILSHTDSDQGKSNNKMIMAITAGLPVIASSSVSYKALAETIGVSEFYVEPTNNALLHAYSLLSHRTNRQAYLDQTQHKIWSLYNADTIAANLVNQLKAL